VGLVGVFAKSNNQQ